MLLSSRLAARHSVAACCPHAALAARARAASALARPRARAGAWRVLPAAAAAPRALWWPSPPPPPPPAQRGLVTGPELDDERKDAYALLGVARGASDREYKARGARAAPRAAPPPV